MKNILETKTELEFSIKAAELRVDNMQSAKDLIQMVEDDCKRRLEAMEASYRKEQEGDKKLIRHLRASLKRSRSAPLVDWRKTYR